MASSLYPMLIPSTANAQTWYIIYYMAQIYKAIKQVFVVEIPNEILLILITGQELTLHRNG